MIDIRGIAQRWRTNAWTGMPASLLVALVLVVLTHPQLPVDDALRHVVSYAWSYSHQAMYPMSSQTDFNQYPLFDYLLGHLGVLLGAKEALKLLQAAAVALVSWSLYRAFMFALSGEPTGSPMRGPRDEDSETNAALLTALVLWAGVIGRALLARPEVFVFGWALLCVSVHPLRKGYWAWVVGAVVGSASYWLAWLTWPLVLLAPWSLRVRLFTLAALGAFHAAFWLWFSNGDYLHVFTVLSEWKTARQLSVTESATAAKLLLSPGVVLLLGLSAYGWSSTKPADRRAATLALLPYIGLNMVRFVGPMLMALHLTSANGLKRLHLPLPVRRAAVIAVALAVLTGFPSRVLPDFKIPEGSRVLTPFGPATFAVPFANPGRVQTLPAMEVGASELQVQLVVKDLHRGKIDCSALSDLGVTHVVEDALWGQVPPCLRLTAVAGPWRLWLVGAQERGAQ